MSVFQPTHITWYICYSVIKKGRLRTKVRIILSVGITNKIFTIWCLRIVVFQNIFFPMSVFRPALGCYRVLLMQSQSKFYLLSGRLQK